MVRAIYYVLSVLSLVVVACLSPYFPTAIYALYIIIPLILLGIYDLRSHHNILRNYPVIGHLRYIFEFIRPEIQQYFVATNLSGRPFSREQRSLVYQRAKNVMDTHPFGTEHDITESGYHFAQHSMNVQKISSEKARIVIGGSECSQPYSASIMNISAMSYGALSPNAIMALNLGAKQGHFYHNTGEGGLSDYHLKHGGDIVWQIGTGYFGCRRPDGGFDAEQFTKKAQLDVVKMIEIKISQGAKPSHGGVLPADKITAEIAHIRGIPMGKDCLSPPTHKTFSTPLELMQYIVELRKLSGGKPVGFKICIGVKREFMAICKAMLETQVYPDFITVDGAEGGTGAAPLIFTNRLGTPIDEALSFVHNCLVGCNIRDNIRIIASGKVFSGFDIAMKIALGANTINCARTFMFSIGCIQALHCNNNKCPTGVTSNDPRRYKAIHVENKASRVMSYHNNTVKAFLELAGAMGCSDPQDLHPGMIYYRVDEGYSANYHDMFHYVEPGNFLSKHIHDFYIEDWKASRPDQF